MMNKPHNGLLGAVLLLSSSALLAAPEVSVSGLMPNQVFAVIDGKTRVLKAGQTSPEGVTLVSANSQSAEFEVDGKRFSRGISRHHASTSTAKPAAETAQVAAAETAEPATPPEDTPASADTEVSAGSNEARLVRGHNHHYFSTGQINGKVVSFMVDTGAYSVAMGYREADRLGLNWKTGTRITASTASGESAGYELNLNSVKVGNITLHNVKGTVIVADIDGPILLGMSFMSRVAMREENNQLVLTKKY